jgi:ClpP class serine protease
LHERFKSWVRQRRSTRLKGEEPAIFDGSFMLGERALALGLIDGFGDVESVARSIAGEQARTRTFRHRRRGLLRRLPRLAVHAVLDAIEERHDAISLRM